MGIRQHVRSNIVGYIALFFALSGGAFALQGKNTVDSGDIKDNKVRSPDIRDGNGVKGIDVKNNGLSGDDVDESTLGQVPSAANADALGGVAPSGYVQTPTEATRLVGTPGNPDFQPGWKNFLVGGYRPAGFFIDQFGIVHLQGVLDPPNSASTIFTLPPKYRPSARVPFVANTFDAAPKGPATRIEVQPDGDVASQDAVDLSLSLEGMTFRAPD